MLVLLALGALAVPHRGPTCSGPLDLGIDEPRPNLTGAVQTYDFADGDFRLHWTVEGRDAPALDVDGVPLLLPIVEEAVVSSRARMVDASWRDLVADDGTGGSPGIDIYLVDITANGFANALTPAEGEVGASCFIRLDPGISGFGAEIAASIATHELAHCFQYRFSIDSDTWLYESSATYEQYRDSASVPELAVPLGVLWAQRLSQPDRPLDDTGDRFEYAGFVWFKFMEEAGFASPPDVWKALEEAPRWQDGLQRTLDPSRLGDVFATFSLYNLFSCARGGTGGYDPAANAHCTASGASVPVVELEVDAADRAELEVDRLQPWTSSSFFVYPPSRELERGERLESVDLICVVEAGAISAAMSELSSGPIGGGVQAREGEQLRVSTPVSSLMPAVAVALGSVGEVPADVRCQVQWVTTTSCGCQTSPVQGLAWAVPLVAWFYRRRRD